MGRLEKGQFMLWKKSPRTHKQTEDKDLVEAVYPRNYQSGYAVWNGSRAATSMLQPVSDHIFMLQKIFFYNSGDVKIEARLYDSASATMLVPFIIPPSDTAIVDATAPFHGTIIASVTNSGLHMRLIGYLIESDAG